MPLVLEILVAIILAALAFIAAMVAFVFAAVLLNIGSKTRFNRDIWPDRQTIPFGVSKG